MSKQTLRQLWSPNRPEPSVDHLVTHGTHMGALEIHVGHYKALYKFNFFTLLFTLRLRVERTAGVSHTHL